jgi:hypothetical protein
MQAALVKIDVAAAVLGKSAPQVFDLVEGGSLSEAGLLWVFNFARNLAGRRRDLRVWLPELKARVAGQPRQYHSQDIRRTLDQILPGGRQRFNAGDVDGLFQIRHRTRLDYGDELPGNRVAGRTVYGRAALESFLARRWIGAAIGRAGK